MVSVGYPGAREEDMGGAIHALQERQEKNHRHGGGWGKAGEGRQREERKLEGILAWPYRVVQFL